MKTYKFKMARRVVLFRQRSEARRNKIGVSLVLSFALVIITSILTNY